MGCGMSARIFPQDGQRARKKYRTEGQKKYFIVFQDSVAILAQMFRGEHMLNPVAGK